MIKITAFFMGIWFAVLSFLGIPFASPDLDFTEENTAVATEENIKLFEKIFESETGWIASLQLENGAIPMTRADSGELRMNPYFANIAVLALLDNAEKYADNAKKYTDWYFSHLNTAEEDFNGLDGTVYDYVITVKNGKLVSEKASEAKDPYDSTDSYAATFLSVLYKYMCKTGDTEYIVSNAADIKRITDVMFATEHNGLTFAKPNNRVKYLMDNCEVYEGFCAAAELFAEIAESGHEEYADTAEKCKSFSLEIKDNINSGFWNYAGSYYVPEKTAHGIPTKVFRWSMYYPCATAQLFPITCGIISPETLRAKNLYDKFSSSYHWEAFDYPDSFYWGNNVYAAAIMNDLDSVVEYMTNYLPLTESHSYPLYNADSARVSMAAYIMLERNL